MSLLSPERKELNGVNLTVVPVFQLEESLDCRTERDNPKEHCSLIEYRRLRFKLLDFPSERRKLIKRKFWSSAEQ